MELYFLVIFLLTYLFEFSSQVAEILKDRMSWYRECRCLDVLSIVPTGSGGTIELMYMQVKWLNRSYADV